MSTSLSRSCLALGVAVWACCALMSWADSYPSKPVRVIVPFPPGSGVDILARSFTPKFAETTGQQFIVDNRGGAAGNIGAGAAAKAPSDGYTLLIAPASLVSSQAMYKDLPFDLARDFDAIAFLATSPMILLVNPNVPAKSPKELIALAKSKPGQLNYGSSGVGGSGHLSVELFRRMAGIELVHVPYKGNATAFADLLGGHLSIMFTGIVSSLSLVKAGQLRALGVGSAKRSQIYPDLPTISESGLTGYESTTWFAMLAPSRTPRNVITQLHGVATKIGQGKAMRERLLSEGAEPQSTTPEQLQAFIRTEIAKWKKVVTAAGIKE